MYKGIDQKESSSNIGKKGGITTDSYQGLSPSGGGTSTVNTHDTETPKAGAIAGGLTTRGGETTKAMADVKKAAKGSFSKEPAPGTCSSEY